MTVITTAEKEVSKSMDDSFKSDEDLKNEEDVLQAQQLALQIAATQDNEKKRTETVKGKAEAKNER